MIETTRTAVVTGASSGIGLSIASALLAHGWNVVANARSGSKLALVTERFAAGKRILAVPGDVGSPETARKLIAGAVERFGKLDMLVNNAGTFLPKPFIDFTEEDIEQQIATNLRGALYGSQEAARHMLRHGGGHIINITAAVAVKPHSEVPAYMAVLLKGGLNAATRALALELAPHAIRVNAIAPGIIDSPMHRPQSHGFLLGMQPCRRLGRVEEVAEAVLYLADAEFVTGVVLPVDGGMTAGNC